MPVRIRERLASEEGISLIELLAAIFIIGLVLAALMSATVGSLYAIQGNERQVRASALANQLLEDLQAVSWDSAGFYSSDPGFVSSFEGEDTVVLPGAASALAGTPPVDCDANRPVPQCRVVRDGITYNVTRHVTWVNASSTSDPQDYKRLMTILTWSQQGKTRTLRTEAFRSPSPQDKPLRPDVTPTRVDLTDPDDPSCAGCNKQSLTVKATTPVPATSVKFRFPRRDGSLSTWTSLSPAPDKRSWTYPILVNTESFANGQTTFQFEATVDGKTVTGTSRVLFLHTLKITNVIVDPNPIKTGATCFATLTVDVQGATTSDSVTAGWTNGPLGPDPLAVSNAPPSGARFQITYPDTLSFAGGLVTGDATVNLNVTRVVDNTSLTTSKLFNVVACS